MSEQARLLIIDDDPDYTEGIKAILEDADYLVDSALDPDEGLQALKSEQYDLLLLDIMMGRGAEGIDIARHMGKDAELRKIPVLIITGIREQMAYLFPGQPVHPRFVDVDEMVEKPVNPDLLLERVETLLKRADEQQEV